MNKIFEREKKYEQKIYCTTLVQRLDCHPLLPHSFTLLNCLSQFRILQPKPLFTTNLACYIFFRHSKIFFDIKNKDYYIHKTEAINQIK